MICVLCHKDYPLITSAEQLKRWDKFIAGPRAKPLGKPLPIPLSIEE